MTYPLITVITPAYDIEQYIGEAIDAVLGQTEGDFEYLIVDDGSTDQTADIARDHATNDSRIRVLDGQHNGSSAARNVGLRQARGRYIAFCDGDDRWAPDFLARSLEVLQNAPDEVGATFCGFHYIDQYGYAWGKTQMAKSGDYDANANLSGHCPQGNGSCLLIKKKCFDEAGLFDEDLRNCVDLDMWLKIGTGSTAPLFRFITEPLVDWRVRPGAISSNEAKRVGGLDVMFERYGHVLRRESRADAYVWPATLAFYAGEDETALRWSNEVKRADKRYFLHSRHGVVLGVFNAIGPRNGRRIRGIAQKALAFARKIRIRLSARVSRR